MRITLVISRVLVGIWLMSGFVWAIELTDDSGTRVYLEQPAQRIVSLAPHLTELLFSVGAGKQIVGVVSYSDFPEAARQIPRVGDAGNLDLELILSLAPDLVVSWQSGNPEQSVNALKALKIPVYSSEPGGFKEIAENIADLGQLTGHVEQAKQRREQFLAQLDTLKNSYGSRTPVQVFYQIWDQPLMTINGDHLISQVITLCGGVNVFADLPVLAPQIDIEAVLARPVDAILVSSQSADSRPLDLWERWQHLEVVREQYVYPIPWDLISRHSLRIVEGAERVCQAIEKVRIGRSAGAQDTSAENRTLSPQP